MYCWRRISSRNRKKSEISEEEKEKYEKLPEISKDDDKSEEEKGKNEKLPEISKDDGKSEESILRYAAIYGIYQSHEYVREKNGKSSVSLRDLQRFKRAYKFFNEYYKNKLDLKKKKGINLFLKKNQ